jgi:hypothetical protein
MIQGWIWSCGGILLTGENRRTERKACPSTNLSTTCLTWTALDKNLGLCDEKLMTEPETELWYDLFCTVFTYCMKIVCIL